MHSLFRRSFDELDAKEIAPLELLMNRFFDRWPSTIAKIDCTDGAA
jgi:hypothetical protein